MPFKIIHDIFTLLLLAATFTVLGVMVGTDTSKLPLYLTNTFYTTYTTDNPALAWSPPTDPYNPLQVTSTFYGCLRTAGVGMAPPIDCSGKEPDAYVDCLQNRTTSISYIAKRFTDGIDNVKKMTNDTLILTNIQSMFTNLPVPITSPLALNTLLAKKGLIYTYLDNIDTAYSRAFKQTFVDFESAWGIQACLVNAEARAGGLDPLTSVYHDLWECASRVLPTTMDQAFAFHQCVPLSAWPALDEVQTPYSLLFLGSYNRIFLLLIAAWITTSFAVFTFWAGESPSDAYGKPTALLARSGVVFSGFCALWNGIGVVLVLVYGFTNTSKPNGLPMTLQTVVVTGVLTLLATGYFIRDFWEQCSFRGNGKVAQAPDDPQASLLPAATPASSGRFFRAGGRQLPIKSMQGYARVVTSGGKNLTDEEYTPLVASSWSDAWLFVDGLFLLAFMGYSNDVVTAEAGRIFLTVTYAAAGHSALIRFMQEAYLEPLGETFKKSVDRYELRVVSIICSWIVLAFAIVAWNLAIPRYPSGIIPGFVSMSSILPVLAWLILTLVVEIQATPHVILYDTTQIVFLAQVLIRAIFIFIGVTMATADADGNTALQNALAALET